MCFLVALTLVMTFSGLDILTAFTASRLANLRLHKELGLRLHYPTVGAALAGLKPANAR
jgi:hypothetical protein